MNYKILLIDDNPKTSKTITDLFSNSRDFKLLFFKKNIDITNIKNNIGFDKFDLIIINCKYENFNQIISNIKSNENLPVFILLENESDEKILTAYQSGGWDYITIKNSKKLIIQKIKQHLKIKNKIEELTLKEAILKEYELKLLTEKKIFTISLDILAHDTKNIFFNIKTLLNDCPNDPIKTMLEDSVNELFEINMEAISFIQNKKRINCLVDIINRIRVTKDRVFLTDFKRIKISCDSKYLYYVETSPLIKNALSNLIENSIKYSSENSIIEVNLQRKMGEIFINIIDEGIGINDDEKSKIFDEYYRCKKNLEIEGSGLGLFISNNIIEKEGGKLLISNNPKGGTIMSVVLSAYKIKSLKDSLADLCSWFEVPLNKIKEKEENIRTILIINGMDKYEDLDSIIFVYILDILRKERMENNQIHIRQKLILLKNKNKNSKKILIIDDSLYVHYYLAVFFTDLGYCISDFAFNGKEGIECYQNNKPDIVTIDYTMPEMNGIDAAKNLIKLNKNVRIIFITAMGDAEIFLEKLNDIIPKKNFQILTKPIIKESIIKALDNLI